MRGAVRAALVLLACCLALPVGAQDARWVVAQVLKDGSIEIEGVRYDKLEPLKEKMRQIDARNPAPVINIMAAKDASFESVRQALKLLQQSGAKMKMGFIGSER